MGHRRSDIDWKSVFLAAFSHDGAVGASSDDSPAPAPQAPAASPRNELERHFGTDPQVDDDGTAFFRLSRAPAAAKAAAAGFEPDVDVLSASKGLRPDVLPAASKGLYDFSPVDEDEQGEHAVSHEHRSKLSPKGKNQNNNGKLPLNKRKSQGHGGKKKPPVTKRKTHTTNSEESDSDYENSLPTRFSKRSKQQLQNSSFVRKVQEVVLLDDDDMEHKEEVNREMSDRLNEPKIYYPSRDDQEAVELNRSDINCLNPEGFLSSPVINFYIKYIKMTRLCNENFRDKFYIFNTYFFGKLEEALYHPRDFPKLRRWWKGVNIFNNAYIILPIHMKEHWSLVIICLPSKERISEPIILHLDSLEMHRSTNILNTVGRYLETEWRFLSVAEPAWPPLLSNIHKETVQVPQQDNAYDCGIFMLYYIEKFIKDAPARFTADKLDMFNHSWFNPQEASRLRQRVRELVLVEFESVARLDNAISKADASKGYENIKKDNELEADDSSKMVVEVGAGLGNIVKSNGGMKVASSEKASEESQNAIKSIEGTKVAETEEAIEVSRDVAKSVEGISSVAGLENTMESNGGMKVATIEVSRDVAKSVEGISSVAGLENTMESNGGMKVATSEEASGESQNVVKSFEDMKVAEPEEASEVSRDATKSMEGISVAGLGNTIESNGGMKVAALEEESGESKNSVNSIDEGIKVAELEEASEVSGDAAKSVEGINVAWLGNTMESNGGMKVATSKEASGESQNVVKSIDEGTKVVELEEASEVSRDVAKIVEGITVAGLGNTVESNRGMKVSTSQEASGESQNVVKSIDEGTKVVELEEASEVSRDAAKIVEAITVVGLGNTVESNRGMKVSTSEEASGESRNAVKSIDEGIIKVAELEEASEVSKNASKRLEGISVAELDEASGASGDTGKSKTNNKGIKVILTSGEASVESEYPANKSMEDHIADVAVVNKGGPTPTSSSNKCNEKNTEATSCSDSVKDKKGTDSGYSSKAEKEGKSRTALPERLKGTDDDEDIIGSSTPTAIQDAVSDSGVKSSEGNNNEEASGSKMVPVPGTVFCEESGTAMWITRVYRPEIKLPLDNWCSCRERSRRDDDARRALIKQFCRPKSNKKN